MKAISFLVLLLVLSVFATNVFAEDEVSIWSGYTKLSVFDENFNKGIERGA